MKSVTELVKESEFSFLKQKREVIVVLFITSAVLAGCVDAEEEFELDGGEPEVTEKTFAMSASCKSNCTSSCLWQGAAEITAKAEANPFLGEPITRTYVLNECGLHRQYEHGHVYTHAEAGTHMIYGAIFSKWAEYGWERGFLEYPVTDELPTSDGRGQYNDFLGGTIYWSPATGAHEVHGTIRDKWNAFGRESGILGFPITDERTTPDGHGKYSYFENGVIYYHGATGTHEVHGDILDKWGSLAWERGYLGYPITDQRRWHGVDYNEFENGYIFKHSSYGTKDAKYWFADRYVYLPESTMDLDWMYDMTLLAGSHDSVDDYRQEVIRIALSEVRGGWSGNEARERYGADKGKGWCSEFVSYVYRKADMFDNNSRNKKRLEKVKIVDDLRDIFQAWNHWHVRDDGEIDSTTIEPGDYLAMTGDDGEKSHSALAVAVTPDHKRVAIAEGNADNKVQFQWIDYYKNNKINDRIDAVGKIQRHWF